MEKEQINSYKTLSERESYGCEKDNYQEQNKFIEQV
jgi:hypothetical protein